MNKFSKGFVALLLGLTIGGCSCATDTTCNCPMDELVTKEELYTTVNNGYKDLFKQTTQSVVMIKVQRKSNGEIKSTGSGVVFMEQDDEAYILTNAHVIKELTNDFEVEVYFSDANGFQSGKSEIARVIGKDFKEDVAVLEINKSDKYKVATAGDSSKIEKGDFVYTIGSPSQKFNHTTNGFISNYNVTIDSFDMSQTGVYTTVYPILFTADINPGNSGGALFDKNGKLIGITTFEYDKLNGMYGALPINYFIKVARDLIINGDNYNRPTLSLTLLSINEMGTSRENYGISSNITTGVFVQNSLENIIAAHSIITEVNEKKVNSVAEFQMEIFKYNSGDTVTLTLVNKDGLNSRKLSIILHD